MSYNPGWCNAKTMANQGCAPKVKKIYDEIVNDPFSSCFFLSTLYARKEEELKVTHPHFWPEEVQHHEIARARVELILISMYLHIKRVQMCGLQSMITETRNT